MIARMLRRWLGITEAEEDASDHVARLYLRIRHLEAEVNRLDALVRALASRHGGHDMNELERRRRMKTWLQANDPDGRGVAP